MHPDSPATNRLNDSRVDLVACIPCFNEASRLGNVVEGALDIVDLVVVVDDGSVDATSEVAREAGALVIRHPSNLGYGRALQSCFDVARALNAEGLVILDGDGQHLPDDIPKVTDPVLNREVDVCIGSRFLDLSGASEMPQWRQMGIRVITGIANMLLDLRRPLTDSQCGFRAYSPSAYRNLHLRADGMGASVEILWQCKRMGLRLKEVPVNCLYHIEKGRIGAIRQGFDVLWVNVLSAVDLLNGYSLEGYRQLVHPSFNVAVEQIVLGQEGLHRNRAKSKAEISAEKGSERITR